MLGNHRGSLYALDALLSAGDELVGAYILRADEELQQAPKCENAFELGRKVRYRLWQEQQESGNTSGKATQFMNHFFHRITPEGRLAQDDFHVLDPTKTIVDQIGARVKSSQTSVSGILKTTIGPYFTLNLTPEQRKMRGLILHMMRLKNAATIHDVNFPPLLRPHILFGGPVKSWQYRCLPGAHYEEWGNNKTGYPIVDKRNGQIIRILIPQADTGTAYYSEG